MTVRIERADFDAPELVDFLQAHLDDLAPTAPAESRHALDLAALHRPGVRLWVAVDPEHDDVIIGTGALAPVDPHTRADGAHEEIKSMRTDPAHRGRGIARQILRRLVLDARDRSVRRLSLETGSMDFFAPARALYASEGFVECAPYGAYVADSNSIFMTRGI